MALGYFSSIDDAKDYFREERLETGSWDGLDDTKREKLINQAYNRIYHSPKFDVPTYADASVAQLVKLRIANAEMAYYLAVHLADEDRRKGLQAQGVTDAGIVKEEYDKDMLKEIPIPPIVEALLEAGDFTTEKAFGMVDIARDEDKAVDEKVDDF